MCHMSTSLRAIARLFSGVLALALAPAGWAPQPGPTPPQKIAPADAPAEIEDWAVHAQSTFVVQYHPRFHSAYQGPNSMSPQNQARETFDMTVYAGARPWQGAELWVNPEVDQGFGLSTTLGAAGFPSGEAYKVGFSVPYARIPRMFVRQTIDLGGETEKVQAGINQFAGSQTANRLVITIGKFSVSDI